MKRFAVATLLVVGSLGLVAEVAVAVPPAGSDRTCTPSFEAMTLAQVRALAAQVGVPDENALRVFGSINKNGDDWICVKDMPSPDPQHYNFVDNQAVGRDKA